MIPPGRRRRFQNCQLWPDDTDGVGRLSHDRLVFTPPYPCVYIPGASEDDARRQRFRPRTGNRRKKPLLIPVVAGAEQGDTFTPFRPWVRMHETQTHHRPGVDGDVERADM